MIIGENKIGYENRNRMNVLSLFDGCSGGQQALERAGIKYNKYYASEIDKYAIKVTQHNYPDTIQLGSVLDVDVTELEPIDMLIGGSPCQSFSFAGKRNGMTTSCSEEIYTLDRYLELKQDGFQFEGESYLFWEYMRILTDIRKYNPDVLFLLENVEMGNKWERILSEAIGIYGVHINSALVSAQNRKRIYWTNIRVKEVGLFGELHSDIPQPEDRGILLKDVLEDEVDEKYYISKRQLERLDIGNIKIAGQISFKNKGVENDKATALLSRDYKGISGHQGFNVCVAMRGRGENNEQTLEPQPSGKSNSLTSVQKDNLLVIPEATSKGYVEVEPGECFDAENINSKTRRGRKMVNKSNCLMAKETDFMKYEIYSKDEERKGKERPNKVLSAMRNIISEKENGEWEMAVYARFFTNEVLFDGLYEIIALNQHDIPSQNLKTGAISGAEINADEQMFGMSETRRNRRSSYRQEPIKQFIRQLAEGMQELSQQNPQTEKALHHLWHSSKRFGLLREALSEIQEIWESTYNKGQSARYTQRIRRLTPLEAERLQTMKDNFTAVVSDSQRYKMIGNGWTIDVVSHIFSFINSNN